MASFSQARDTSSPRRGSLRRPARGREASRRLTQRLATIRFKLLHWGQAHQRSFVWRVEFRRPFVVVVSEILLARTRADSVDPVVRVLLKRYPTPRKLAMAIEADVRKVVRPLGLHRMRGSMLVRCAKQLTQRFGGHVPKDLSRLTSLPGVGRYAAHAIASAAFNRRVVATDANVARVIARVFSRTQCDKRITDADRLWEFAQRLVGRSPPRLFNWFLMDFAATVCTPRSPRCAHCPIAAVCDRAQRRPA